MDDQSTKIVARILMLLYRDKLGLNHESIIAASFPITHFVVR
jgi:hypothetical protein